MELIMHVGRQPFPELKLAVLQVLNVLGEQQWGQEYIKGFAELVTTLFIWYSIPTPLQISLWYLGIGTSGMWFVDAATSVGLAMIDYGSSIPWEFEGLKIYFGGLIEFLLDRSTESTKLCKDAKFEVLRTIVSSPTSESVFGSETILRFKNYIREGPVYVHVETEVAIEGSS
ncbi:unnamed protein product [Timema podura]|uniref:Uncharacterized protein n=1 Tax=Timema podura TaxID=61482 RepID=A0ABN7NSW0_TIMPD|nr:unnamed protein product [Timema podura]